MRVRLNWLNVLLTSIALLLFYSEIVSASEVGVIKAIQGDVKIYRGKDTVSAKSEDKLFLSDTVVTADLSKVKMRFTDDSAITLFENSVLNVKEYLYNKEEKKGSSVFKLLDGKLKALVGKTKFEIHTPTALAAARGTYFFVEILRDAMGALYTRISLLEGRLVLRNIDASVSGVVFLEEGQTSTIYEGKAPVPPETIDNQQLKDLLNCKITNQGAQQ